MTETARPQRPLRHTPAQIRGSLKFYRVAAILTGTFLLLLCVELIAKRFFGFELYAGGVNLSRAVLIVHGWLYVVYLLADFTLFSRLRWPLSRFLLIALGGVVPFLSFIVESRIRREVEGQLDALETHAPRY